MSTDSAPWQQRDVLSFSEHSLRSYQSLLGRELTAPGSLIERAARLFEADYVVLSHTAANVPVYNYGNALALKLWELPWDAFVAMESHKCAEPMAQEARDCFLQEVETQGFATGHSGVRISASGRRFRIDDVTCWNVYDEAGTRIGQAATYQQRTFL